MPVTRSTTGRIREGKPAGTQTSLAETSTSATGTAETSTGSQLEPAQTSPRGDAADVRAAPAPTPHGPQPEPVLTVTASRGDAADVRAAPAPHGSQPEPVPASKRTSIASRRSKQKKIEQARQEVIRLQLELATARLSALENGSDEEEEDDCNHSIISAPSVRRVSDWVDKHIAVSTVAPQKTEDVATPAPLPPPTPAAMTAAPSAPPRAIMAAALPSALPPSSQAIMAAALPSALPPSSQAIMAAAPPSAPHPQLQAAMAAAPPDALHLQQQAAMVAALPAEKNEEDRAFYAAPLPTSTYPYAPPPKIDLTDLATAIASAAKGSNARHGDLPQFSGSHHEWLFFRAAYYESAAAHTETERIARLRRSLRGAAKEAVERLLLYNAESEAIMRTLETRFGRPDAIAQTELDRLRGLPRPTDAPRDICVFATRIGNIVATLRALNRSHYLYSPEMTRTTIEKLPSTVRYKWFAYAAACKHVDQPDLVKLSEFLDIEAENCAPYAQPEAATQPEKVNAAPSKPRVQKTFATTVSKPRRCPACNNEGHNIASCGDFKKLDSDGRWDLAKQHHLCFRCLRHRDKTHKCSRSTCGEDGCNRSHHRLLHFVRRDTETPPTSPTPPTPPSETVATAARATRARAYLKIVPVRVSGPAGVVDAYGLLDDGSTITLVEEGLARQVGAEGPLEPLQIEAFSDAAINASKSRRVTLALEGATCESHSIEAHTIDRVRLSPQQVRDEDLHDCPHLEGLIDQLRCEAQRPKILIGQDNWELLIAREVRRGPRDRPVASLTPLGWVLHGTNAAAPTQRRSTAAAIVTSIQDDKMDAELRDFFAIESMMVEPRRPKTDPEERALTILREGTTRTATGHFEVPLPWKTEDRQMPNNYESTLRRLHGTERRIDKCPALKKRYREEMDALVEKGYAEVAPEQKTPGKTWYLPHFPVLNPMKPDKVRVVHDAAAKTDGTSLNDHLLTGPDLLQSLPGVLMRFRQRKIAVGADIREMFLQVKIRPQDRDSLRYLWRGDRRDGSPTEYRMTSLIFGATCSPSIAIYVKDNNADAHAREHPAAALAIRRNHYVDDYLASYDTEQEAKQIAAEVRKIHSDAHYELRHWTSNSRDVLTALDPDAASSTTVDLGGETKKERVLGLIWVPNTDRLTFNMDLSRLPPNALENEEPTKRQVLQIMMSIFDPLGFVSPVTIAPKRLIQEVWRRGTGWDDKIDEDLAQQWRAWLAHMKNLRNITVPRCYPDYSHAESLQLHIFTDASETTYSAALYWRARSADGTVRVSLITAKAKVAPLKLTSIPRLELQAAVLGARMASWVIEEHDVKPQSKTFWTDSRTVLTWLKTGARSYRPFVAHRIASIEELSAVSEWRWVPTKHNVADDATRDVPVDFNGEHRWFNGPEFLYRDPSTWPETAVPAVEKTGEEKEKLNTLRSNDNIDLQQALPDVERFSKWERLVRATARVLQFIDLCRPRDKVNYRRTRRTTTADPAWRHDGRQPRAASATPTSAARAPVTNRRVAIDANLLRRAEELLVRADQAKSFAQEINDLARGVAPSKSSRLYKTATETSNGILVVKTRIDKTEDIPTTLKKPPILDGNGPLARLYVDYTHRSLHHAGVEATINECRQHYWVLRLRPVTKMVLHRCLQCRRRRVAPPVPPTGDHPQARLAHHRRPFTHVGLDYFGPISVAVNRTTQKRYVALFTCLTTRAVHLEVAATLSVDSAIMALRRMIARRGCPSEIWSDNGTNFHGADKELRRTIDAATQEEASKHTIHWRFIPPGAPFMGGAWERMVRSVKTALATVLHEKRPTDEVLATLLAEVEFTVNSRPLTHVSVDPADPEALTPNHFLLLGPARIPTAGDFTDADLIGRTHWRASQRLADAFWDRWLREYLPTLQDRREPHGRGPTAKIGDIVLVVDTNQPRNTWPLGIITAVYPGPDGVVRTVDVFTQGTTRRRAVKKIVILPTEQPPYTHGNNCADSGRHTAGEMCRTATNE